MLPALQTGFVRKRREYVIPRMCGWKQNKHMDWTDVCTMLEAIEERVALNPKMRPMKDELETDYYKRFLKYCSGKCVTELSLPIRKKYKTHDKGDTGSTSSISTQSVSVRTHSKGKGTTHPPIDPKEFMELKRTVAWLTAQYGKRPDDDEIPYHRSYDDNMDSTGSLHNEGHERTNVFATPDSIPQTPVEVETNTQSFDPIPQTRLEVETNTVDIPIKKKRVLVKTQWESLFLLVIESTPKATKHRKHRQARVASEYKNRLRPFCCWSLML